MCLSFGYQFWDLSRSIIRLPTVLDFLETLGFRTKTASALTSLEAALHVASDLQGDTLTVLGEPH